MSAERWLLRGENHENRFPWEAKLCTGLVAKTIRGYLTAMSGQSLIDRYQLFFAAAVAAAHGPAFERDMGFRQRDVRFYLELFFSWVKPSYEWEELPVQNTHISRYLAELERDSFARKISRTGRGNPEYRLTRTGLMELISRIVQTPYHHTPEYFFFAYSFVENYRPRMLALVRREGTKFPYALQVELEAMVNLEAMLERQIEMTRREVRTLEKRISDQIGTKELVEKLVKEGAEYKEVVREVEKHFPYSLNPKKPFSELIKAGTRRQALWELCVGGIRRNEQMWKPARERLLQHLKQLGQLGEQSKIFAEANKGWEEGSGRAAADAALKKSPKTE